MDGDGGRLERKKTLSRCCSISANQISNSPRADRMNEGRSQSSSFNVTIFFSANKTKTQ
jgi:hypothetical protein